MADYNSSHTGAEIDSAVTTANNLASWVKAAQKPSYTAEEVGALPEDTAIPTKTSDLTNDSGFLTQHQSLSAYRTSSAQDTIDAGKQSKSIGSAYAGDFLVVGSDGNITHKTITAWQGGNY